MYITNFFLLSASVNSGLFEFSIALMPQNLHVFKEWLLLIFKNFATYSSKLSHIAIRQHGIIHLFFVLSAVVDLYKLV